jgi:two-component system sensor kinase FixL
MTPSERAWDALGDAVILVDVDNDVVLWVSRGFRDLLQLDVMEGQTGTWSDLVARIDGLASVSEDSGDEQRKILLPNPSHLPSWLEVQRVPVLPGQWVVRLVDPMDRERAAQRHLEDREQLLFTSRSVSVGEMATTLAHDINQPLGTVTNVLNGLHVRIRRAMDMNQPMSCEEMSHLLQGLALATDQSRFAARIIGRIRDYTRLRQPQHEPIDPHDLLRDSVDLLDWEIQRDGIQISWSFDPSIAAPGVCCINGDVVMLQQVIVNLLRNALDAMRHTPPGRRHLTVSTCASRGHRTGDELEIALSDTGCGLSAEVEQRLFVPFASTKPNGMGIGLSICRSFIELHQGRLWFTRNPDVGCTFHIALPLCPADSSGPGS